MNKRLALIGMALAMSLVILVSVAIAQNASQNNSPGNNRCNLTVSDGVCPSVCGTPSDADCCTQKGYHVLRVLSQGFCGHMCFSTDYPPEMGPCSHQCSFDADGMCPPWCGIAADVDCCTQKGYYMLDFGFTPTVCLKGCYQTNYTPGTKPCMTCSGKIKDGACPNWCIASGDADCEPVKMFCKDSDERNTKTKGTITTEKGDLTDYCVSDYNQSVLEYYCGGTVSIAELLPCDKDEKCRDGKCVAQTTAESVTGCTDSDNGKDVYVNGNTASGTTSKTDGCSGTANVVEYFCSGKEIQSLTINCPTNYKCSNGACRNQTPTPPPVTPPTPVTGCTDSDNGRDIYTKGTTADSREKQVDSCLLSRVKEHICTPNGLGGQYVLGEFFDCPAGFSCSDGACKTAMAPPTPITNQPPTPPPPTPTPITNQTPTPPPPTPTPITNQTPTPPPVTPPTPVTGCTDSDNGKDVYTQGTTKSGTSTKKDSCSGTIKVVEHYCSGKKIQSSTMKCPSGFSCSNGACTTTGATGCTDSDGGKNTAIKGTTTNAKETRTDKCSRISKNKVLESYCSGKDVRTTTINCPTGQKCSDGACVTG